MVLGRSDKLAEGPLPIKISSVGYHLSIRLLLHPDQAGSIPGLLEADCKSVP